jgi:hypothetical protein
MAFLRIVVLAAAVAMSSACAGPDARGPFRGHVIDVDTGRPLEGAIVLVTWHYESSLAHPRTRQFDAQDAVTDNEGRWEVSALPRRETLFKLDVTPQFWTFMPGYDFAGAREDQATGQAFAVVSLRRLETREERCERLFRPTALSLEPREKMPRFVAAMERERSTLKCGSLN